MAQPFFDADAAAWRIWEDYCKGYGEMQRSSTGADTPVSYVMPIKQLVTEYLGLTVYRASLGDGVLGVTTYCDTTLTLPRDGREVEVSIPEGTILLDKSLYTPVSHTRYRFTLAHEAGHQLICLSHTTEAEMHFRTVSTPRTPSDLHNASSWCEVDANALASALLMPEWLVRRLFSELFDTQRLTVYGAELMSPEDMRKFHILHRSFDVSSKAMLIRLQGLGMLQLRPIDEYTKMYPPRPRPYDMFEIPVPPYYISRLEIEQGREYFINADGIVMAYGVEAPLEPDGYY